VSIGRSLDNFTCTFTLLLSMTRSPKWSFLLKFPNKILYVFRIYLMHATCPAYLVLLDVMDEVIMFQTKQE